ncbi:MAG: DMT family transporter [Verrucomicrobiia bacterium]
MQLLAGFCFLLVTFLWGTFYSVTKEALERIDPIIFAFLETSMTLPFAIGVLIWNRKKLFYELWKSGIVLGFLLYLNLLTAAIALAHTTATNTAFFPSINGIIVTVMAWLMKKNNISLATWVAGLFSLLGTILLITSHSSFHGQWRGDLIALLAPLFYACYIFRIDYDTRGSTQTLWPLIGIELITLCFLCGITAFFFSDWSHFDPDFPKDFYVIGYVGLLTTLFPVIVSTLLQKYLSPISVAFIFILEPIWGTIIAAIYLGEKLNFIGYLGGSLIILASMLNTLSSSRRQQTTI